MAQVAIPLAGAAIGFWIGGPTGASIGWSIGSYLAYEPEQPEIGDLRVQTSQYGAGIPFIVGKQRITGNIIWTADKTSYSVETGGKGGAPGTNQVGYKISMAIAICQGPILGISRVWEQGEVKADINNQARLPGTLYLGTNTQTADSTIEAYEGVGNVPAYRGIAYMVLEDFDLGVSGTIPQFSFEVVKAEAL